MKMRLLISTLLVFLSVTYVYAHNKIRIMTTFTVLEDITKNIVGDRAIVESLTKIGAEIHEYNPSPQDIKRLDNTDIIIYNGLNLERWFKRFIQNKNIPILVASAGIKPIIIQDGPYKGTPNPHGWMSIENAQYYVNNIVEGLSKFDPQNAKYYKENGKKYLAKINGLKKDHLNFKHEWLITSEGAFSYLVRDFNGIKYDSIWPVNAEAVGTPRQISRMIDLIKKEKIKVVFSGSTMDVRPMQAIMKATGAHFGGYLYVDTLSEKDGPIPTYYDMLSKTMNTIYDAFAKYNY